MKKTALIVVVLFVGVLLFASSVQAGSLYGWTMTGNVTTYYDITEIGSPWHAKALSDGSSLSQTIQLPPDNYNMSAFCVGNDVFSIIDGDGTPYTRTCPNATTYTMLGWDSFPLKGGSVTVLIQMNAGDKADELCFFTTASNHCPPSLLVNWNFDQDPPPPTSTPTATPTPCIPKGKSGKCK